MGATPQAVQLLKQRLYAKLVDREAQTQLGAVSGGAIRVNSVPDKRATFTLRIPGYREKTADGDP